MTAAVPDKGPSPGSGPAPTALPQLPDRQPEPEPESEALSGRGVGDGDGDAVSRAEKEESGQPGQQQPGTFGKEKPWWKKRRAWISFAGAAAALLVIFVVLLVLGVLGYFEVGGVFSFYLLCLPRRSNFSVPLSTIPLFGPSLILISMLVHVSLSSASVAATAELTYTNLGFVK